MPFEACSTYRVVAVAVSVSGAKEETSEYPTGVMLVLVATGRAVMLVEMEVSGPVQGSAEIPNSLVAVMKGAMVEVKT